MGTLSKMMGNFRILAKALPVCWIYFFLLYLSMIFFPSRYLYWADYGQTPSITRARLDASNRTNLVTTGVSIPRDICIDMSTHKVYWVDSVTSNLERIDWDGGNRAIIRSGLTNPHGLAIYLNKVNISSGVFT